MVDDYEKALKLGKRQVKEAKRANRNPYASVLEELLEERGDVGEKSLGTMEIPLEMVVGTRTRGRVNVLSYGFMPLAEPASEFAAKWRALIAAQRDEGMRDPIVVCEYQHRFYVQEGNKRVSVARYLDMPTIRAKVTRIVARAAGDEDQRPYREFLRFFSSCPIWELEFTTAGSYQRLADILGLSLEEEWPEELVLKLKASYARFAKAYRKHKGESATNAAASDAFLEYLAACPEDDLLDMSEKELKGRVKTAASQSDTEGAEDQKDWTGIVPKPSLEAASAITDAAKAVVTTTAKAVAETTAKSAVATTAKAVVTTTAKAVTETTAKSAVATAAKSVVATTAKSALSIGAESIATLTGKDTTGKEA